MEPIVELVRMLAGGFAIAFLVLDLLAAAFVAYSYKENWPEGGGCAMMVAIPITINLIISTCIWIATFL